MWSLFLYESVLQFLKFKDRYWKQKFIEKGKCIHISKGMHYLKKYFAFSVKLKIKDLQHDLKQSIGKTPIFVKSILSFKLFENELHW